MAGDIRIKGDDLEDYRFALKVAVMHDKTTLAKWVCDAVKAALRERAKTNDTIKSALPPQK